MQDLPSDIYRVILSKLEHLYKVIFSRVCKSIHNSTIGNIPPIEVIITNRIGALYKDINKYVLCGDILLDCLLGTEFNNIDICRDNYGLFSIAGVPVVSEFTYYISTTEKYISFQRYYYNNNGRNFVINDYADENRENRAMYWNRTSFTKVRLEKGKLIISELKSVLTKTSSPCPYSFNYLQYDFDASTLDVEIDLTKKYSDAGFIFI